MKVLPSNLMARRVPVGMSRSEFAARHVVEAVLVCALVFFAICGLAGAVSGTEWRAFDSFGISGIGVAGFGALCFVFGMVFCRFAVVVAVVLRSRRALVWLGLD